MKSFLVTSSLVVIGLLGFAGALNGAFAPSKGWLLASLPISAVLAGAYAKHYLSRPATNRRSALYGKPDKWLQVFFLFPPIFMISYLFTAYPVGTAINFSIGDPHIRWAEVSSWKHRGGRRRIDCVEISAGIKRDTEITYVSLCLSGQRYRHGPMLGAFRFRTVESPAGIFALPM